MEKSNLLQGKTALITGGARGIGKAIAIKLAQHGADIIIIYYNSSDEAEKLKLQLEKTGSCVSCFQANVADEQSVKELSLKIKNQYENIDFLISNAASGVLKPALKMTTKHWRWCMETNALALNHLVKNLYDILSHNGRVLALSSLGADRAIPNYSFIGASKAALESLIRYLALELAEKKINVNCVSAGVVDTDALKYFPNRDELLSTYESRSLAQEPLLPSHVADAVYLLCLPEAKMINAQTIYVDAGYSKLG